MAKATPVQIIKSVAGGIEHKATIRKPLKAFGAYFQAARSSLTIRAKTEPTDRSRKGLPFQKELYCYADLLYKSRSRFWIKLWADYYRGERAVNSPVIMGGAKHLKTYVFDAKKDIGRHSQWIRVILKDQLDAFNDKFINARWVITDLTLDGTELTFKTLFTNRSDEEVTLLYFDINLLRMAGRI